jgi:hypothetical protein
MIRQDDRDKFHKSSDHDHVPEFHPGKIWSSEEEISQERGTGAELKHKRR